MNTYQINGAPLGNGTPDNRGFMALSTLARATTSFVLTAWRFIGSSLTARATSSILMTGTVYVVGSTTGSASSTIDLQVWTPQNLNAIGTVAKCVTSMALVAKIPLTGASTARAMSAVSIGGQLALTGATTGRATSTVTLLTTGQPAPDERVMWVDYEDRIMWA